MSGDMPLEIMRAHLACSLVCQSLEAASRAFAALSDEQYAHVVHRETAEAEQGNGTAKWLLEVYRVLREEFDA